VRLILCAPACSQDQIIFLSGPFVQLVSHEGDMLDKHCLPVRKSPPTPLAPSPGEFLREQQSQSARPSGYEYNFVSQWNLRTAAKQTEAAIPSTIPASNS
jgi:hypothetical protein